MYLSGEKLVISLTYFVKLYQQLKYFSSRQTDHKDKWLAHQTDR
jgi:hypothetical protein